MNRLDLARKQAQRRKTRTRSNIIGTAQRPRLSVFISDRHVTAQIINDEVGKTIAHSTSAGVKSVKGTMTEKAAWVGSDIAKKAKAAKVKQVVMDRGAKQYHGRVQALADAARKEGLEF